MNNVPAGTLYRVALCIVIGFMAFFSSTGDAVAQSRLHLTPTFRLTRDLFTNPLAMREFSRLNLSMKTTPLTLQRRTLYSYTDVDLVSPVASYNQLLRSEQSNSLIFRIRASHQFLGSVEWKRNELEYQNILSVLSDTLLSEGDRVTGIEAMTFLQGLDATPGSLQEFLSHSGGMGLDYRIEYNVFQVYTASIESTPVVDTLSIYEIDGNYVVVRGRRYRIQRRVNVGSAVRIRFWDDNRFLQDVFVRKSPLKSVRQNEVGEHLVPGVRGIIRPAGERR